MIIIRQQRIKLLLGNPNPHSITLIQSRLESLRVLIHEKKVGIIVAAFE